MLTFSQPSNALLEHRSRTSEFSCRLWCVKSALVLNLIVVTYSDVTTTTRSCTFQSLQRVEKLIASQLTQLWHTCSTWITVTSWLDHRHVSTDRHRSTPSYKLPQRLSFFLFPKFWRKWCALIYWFVSRSVAQSWTSRFNIHSRWHCCNSSITCHTDVSDNSPALPTRASTTRHCANFSSTDAIS